MQKFTDKKKGKKVVDPPSGPWTLQKGAAGWSMIESTWAQH